MEAGCRSLHGRCKRAPLILLLVLSLLFSIDEATAKKCSLTGLCSVGKVQPFVGDIHDTGAFRTAMAARSYKQELIIMLTTVDRMLPTLQTITNFERLGYAHQLIMSRDGAECAKVVQHIPHIGCAWDRFQLPMRGKDTAWMFKLAPLWHARWRAAARAVRMGINVFLTDSDIVIFNDPYRVVKSPPFNDFVIINQPETLHHQDHYTMPNPLNNGGLIYIQNAKPDGPASWLIAEVSDRLLRWIDDDFNVTRAQGVQSSACYLDQDCFNDAFSSVLSGRPLFRISLQDFIIFDFRLANGSLHDRRVGALKEAVQGRIMLNRTVPLPRPLHDIAGDNTTKLQWARMLMPTTEGTWPEHLGGKLYPEKRGPLSTRFMEQLKDDCNCPLWPDPEDPSPATVARAKNMTELFAFAPPWLFFGYYPRGRLGMWEANWTGVPQQVIGHAHYIPETDAKISKMVVRMMSGLYDWEQAHEVMRSEGVFFANLGRRVDHVRAGSTPDEAYIAHDYVPKLVALHPRVHLDLVYGYEEMMAVLRGLMQVAAVSGRTVLWPDLPCDLPWLSVLSPDGMKTVLEAGQPPYKLNNEWLPWREPVTGRLRCSFRRLLYESCLYTGRGLLGVEFLHYRARHGLRHDLDPGAGNAAFIPAVLRGPGRLNQTVEGPAAVIVEVPDVQVAEHMEQYKDDLVVYLAHPVQVAFTKGSKQEAAYLELYGACVPEETVKHVQVFIPRLLSKPSRTKVLNGTMVNGRLWVKGQEARAAAAGTGGTAEDAAEAGVHGRRYRQLQRAVQSSLGVGAGQGGAQGTGVQAQTADLGGKQHGGLRGMQTGEVRLPEGKGWGAGNQGLQGRHLLQEQEGFSVWGNEQGAGDGASSCVAASSRYPFGWGPMEARRLKAQWCRQHWEGRGWEG